MIRKNRPYTPTPQPNKLKKNKTEKIDWLYSEISAYNIRMTGTKTSAIIDISLIRMLMDGPEVSLNGSPTVSPTTAAL